MLGAEDNRVDPYRYAIAIFDGDLGLSVGAEVGESAILADGGHSAAELVCKGDGHGHQLRCVGAGEADHHTLVPGADEIEVVALVDGELLLLCFQRAVDAQGNVTRLLLYGYNHTTGLVVEAVLGPGIARVPNHVPGDSGNIDIGIGGDLSGDQYEAGGSCRLTCHAPLGVLGQDRIQDSVGNLVAQLVGVPFGD